ncbi:MAG: ABC transporter substrate-binding protein, partial [Alphaproteobacteria bacterium]|nr:ABC transporter substrate-binding protein [Alphaproteobacteria bacterium]
LFFTAFVAPDMWNPIANFGLNGACDKAWQGWPCDAKLEELRNEFARSTDEGAKKKIAENLQVRGFEIGTHAPVGEYVAPAAVRKGIKGLVIGPGDFYWGIRKD